MSELPGSVLFACSHNAIRSPMAENILRYFHGRRIFVQSAGVRPAELDPFAVAVMDEIGIDISRHRAAQLRPARRRLFRRCHLALARGPAQRGRADPQQPLRAAVLAVCPTQAGRRLARESARRLSGAARPADAANPRAVPARGRAGAVTACPAGHRTATIFRYPRRSVRRCRSSSVAPPINVAAL